MGGKAGQEVLKALGSQVAASTSLPVIRGVGKEISQSLMDAPEVLKVAGLGGQLSINAHPEASRRARKQPETTVLLLPAPWTPNAALAFWG